MDYRKLTQENRDELLKKELSPEKVKLIEKFALQSSPDLYWVSVTENAHEHKIFRHQYLKNNDIIRALFRINRLCFAKVNYFSRQSDKFEPQSYDYKKGFSETDWWNADFLKHNASGFQLDLRYLKTITDIKIFHELCDDLESFESQPESTIREAETKEHILLTNISFQSKRYWNYPESFFDIWKDELTITENYISGNDVYVYEINGNVTGYYSIVTLRSDLAVSEIIIEAGIWLEHMFILPEFIGKGIGRQLFTHCVEKCAKKNTDRIKILADPNASQFYEKMGCRFIKEYPSTIAGRTTPYLEYIF